MWRFFCLALLCLGQSLASVSGQQTQPAPNQPAQTQTQQNQTQGTQNPQAPSQAQTPQDQPDEVLRISTELVQTDVMVFDKNGRFVDNLKPEQFQLKVDGKPQPLAFFERVAAGSVSEEAQLAAARGEAPPAGSKAGAAKPLDRGRTVIFFLDDLHLSFESLERARKSLLRFIDDEMGQNDVAVITSASGRIGFLQQFTGNKAVLRAAVARLRYQPYQVTGGERPPMSEYQAFAIEHNDQDALSYFIDQLRRDFPMSRDSAESTVRARAHQILAQASLVTTNTLSTLESLMRSAARLPGRKVVFFMSDGFFLDERNGNPLDRLRRITSEATRSGVVIYAMDARGLVTGMPDASAEGGFDPTGRLSRMQMGETAASQEPLFALASETGGRAMINSNAPFSQIKQALDETAVYYLLVWRPDPASQHGAKYRRLEVNVLGHPEFKVRARRGFLSAEAMSAARESKDKTRARERSAATQQAAPPPADAELRAAIGDIIPHTNLPTQMRVNYLDLPGKGMIMTLAMQVAAEALEYKPEGGKRTAQVSMAGLVLNDQGKQVNGFRDQVSVNTTRPEGTAIEHGDVIYSYQTPLAPGLYQVRVAARDGLSGRTGSDIQWIEIPNLATHQLALSSLFIGELKKDQSSARTNNGPAAAKPSNPNKPGEPDNNPSPLQVNLSVDGRFAHTSQLRFLTYIYNASRGQDGKQQPDVALQIQIFRDNQPVLTNALRKVQTEGFEDLTRIPYAAEIALAAMPAGRYVLQVTAIDRLAKTSATQRTDFTIE